MSFTSEEEDRSVGGRMNARRALSALEVRRVVPSGDLQDVSWRGEMVGSITIVRF